MKDKKKRKKLPPWKEAQLAVQRNESWKIHDWYEEVSRTTIHPDLGASMRLKLTAFGMGMPPQELLQISSVDDPEVKWQFGVDRASLEKLGRWCIECIYLLDSLRDTKDRQAARLRKHLVEIHSDEATSEWTKKTSK